MKIVMWILIKTLVDFARGLSAAKSPEIDKQRGTWKLGDAPYAIAVVVTSNDDLYTLDPTYQFLDGEQTMSHCSHTCQRWYAACIPTG